MKVEEAQKILGKNFFDLSDWIKYVFLPFGLPVCLPSKELFFEWSTRGFPWGEDILNSPCPFNSGRRVWETHFAFLGIEQCLPDTSLTAIKWNELFQEKFQRELISFELGRFDHKAHLQEPSTSQVACKFRWYMMPLVTDELKLKGTYEQQRALLPKEYEVPTVIEEISRSLLYFLKYKTFPVRQDDFLNRCAETYASNDKICRFCVSGIDYYKPHIEIKALGDTLEGSALIGNYIRLAASRKLPNV